MLPVRSRSAQVRGFLSTRSSLILLLLFALAGICVASFNLTGRRVDLRTRELVSPKELDGLLSRLGSAGGESLRVMVVMGTRPEAIKVAPIILEMRRRKQVDCVVVSTGQHREMLRQVLDLFKLSSAVDLELDVMEPNQSLEQVSVRVLEAVGVVLRRVPVDVVLVQGDTTTAMAAALAAFYAKIPVAHVEAGLRTRNIYSPFPEEVNRQIVGVLASVHFPATMWASMNLLKEGKPAEDVFLTGNPVVDSLRRFTSDTSAASPLIDRLLMNAMQKLPKEARVILLTAHRRENHGAPLERIIAAAFTLLSEFPDLFIIYPVHLNPNVRGSIQKAVPESVFEALSKNQILGDPQTPWSRLMLIQPLDYQDLVQLMKASYVILTDSGGIQEEGVSLGKPILVLRESTERPEGVEAGAAKLVGTDTKIIVNATRELLLSSSAYADMARAQNLYGDGHASERIVDVLEWRYLHKRAGRPESVPSSHSQMSSFAKFSQPSDIPADVVLVVTVYKRPTLQRYMEMICAQTMLKRQGIVLHVVIFQNGFHQNVTEIVADWSDPEKWKRDGAKARVVVTFIHSHISTGYYGRFLVPMSVATNDNARFVVFDDDLIFGNGYVENMIRVVDEGFLATRNGRFVSHDANSGVYDGSNPGSSFSGWSAGVQVTFETDVPYDFGGHIWAGRIEWLKLAWRHPPPTIITAEDFWISAVLKTHGGILTRRPRCPKTDVEQCACSSQEASSGSPAELGAKGGSTNAQSFLSRQPHETHVGQAAAFVPLDNSAREFERSVYTFWSDPARLPFKLAGTRFQNCLFWI